jgi:hypothetical protein
MTRISRRSFAKIYLAAGGASLIPAFASKALASPGASYTNFASLGGVPDNPLFDNAPILNSAISTGVRNLYIPRGSWHFLTKPNAISYEMEIVGEGFSSTVLVRRYPEFTFTNGLLTFRAGNQHVMRLGILAGANTVGGAGISFHGDNTSSPDFSVVEDVYVSQEPGSSGTWQDAILIHGTQRNSNGLIGVRSVSLRNCQLFASTNSACQVNGGVAINIWGGGMFPAGGTTGRLQITGTSQIKSHYVSVDVPYIGGIYLDNCNYVNIKSAVIAGNITNASTANDVLVSGKCSGTVQSFWTRGRHVDPAVPGS